MDAVAANAVINALLGVLCIAVVIGKVLHDDGEMDFLQQCGLCFAAGGMILVTPSLWIAGSPFDEWSFNFSRGGLALFLVRSYAPGWLGGRGTGRADIGRAQ